MAIFSEQNQETKKAVIKEKTEFVKYLNEHRDPNTEIVKVVQYERLGTPEAPVFGMRKYTRDPQNPKLLVDQGNFARIGKDLLGKTVEETASNVREAVKEDMVEFLTFEEDPIPVLCVKFERTIRVSESDIWF
jgi:hypothetical protein